MSAIAATDALFFDTFGLDPKQAEQRAAEAVEGCDDGELYLEYRRSESLGFDDGKLKTAVFDAEHGFGLRAVAGEATGYAHASDLSDGALKKAVAAVQAVRGGHSGSLAVGPRGTNAKLYGDLDPIDETPFEVKSALLAEIDGYLRAKDPKVVQVSASLAASWQAVRIIRGDGKHAADIRPLVRLNVSVIVEKDGRRETGSAGAGGRASFDAWIAPDAWKVQADEALRQALVNLESVPAPAGEMTVVLGPGWPGVLLHEAVGHGLEGDFNRKKTSAFSGRVGERVASPGVTIIDDGTMPDRRGSLTIDDEGEPTQRTTLIEDGILVGYMQDRLNARLMGEESTGNGRRQSYAHRPMPRMTNTVMLSGDADPAEVLSSTKSGLYAVQFGGGQVDITSGKFVFSCTEAYLIENGKVGAPVKGATLIGDGPTSLTKVGMIGNDSALDDGIGTCGKDGQGVPVGVGQPTMRIDGLTVGGTAA